MGDEGAELRSEERSEISWWWWCMVASCCWQLHLQPGAGLLHRELPRVAAIMVASSYRDLTFGIYSLSGGTKGYVMV